MVYCFARIQIILLNSDHTIISSESMRKNFQNQTNAQNQIYKQMSVSQLRNKQMKNQGFKEETQTTYSSEKTQSENQQSHHTEGKKSHQFINEPVEDWPQWSIQVEEEDFESKIPSKYSKEKNIVKFFSLYNRGMDKPLREKIMKVLMPVVKQIWEENKNKPEGEQYVVQEQANRRLKGWRKILVPEEQK